MHRNPLFFLALACMVFLPPLYQLTVPSPQAFTESSDKPLPATRRFSAVEEIIRGKCVHCHTRGYALPFYAAIPGIRQIIESNYYGGLRAMDLNEELGKARSEPVGEATLAKMEWVTENGTMPPAVFAAVHMDGRMTREERDSILVWVKNTRAAYYATATAAPERAGEPVQPLPDTLGADQAKAALGERLFADKRLSADDSIACISCHLPEQGGADGRRLSEGVGKRTGVVNAPGIYNVAFNIRQFWDGRAESLRAQVSGPIFNPVEMASKNWDQIIGKLSAERELLEAFLDVYPISWLGDSGGWTGENIADALAEYEYTLITPNSRFDQWLKGDETAISRAEFYGYQRFKAYRCSSCHVGKSLGGQSFEYMDLKRDYFRDRGGELPSDAGLKAFTGKDEDLHKFKVPNLRNIELTAPYLHDGSVNTLDETVRIMGVYLSGMEIVKDDRDLIVAFLRSLTGEHRGKKLQGTPVPE
ncbi:MAG: heme-binding domain-containing protein [Desulfovibrio sp.]|jgi:cytochrome c peroxidase|nr:heme-binding domain-containing protein [Desulfovibrio sp.]